MTFWIITLVIEALILWFFWREVDLNASPDSQMGAGFAFLFLLVVFAGFDMIALGVTIFRALRH